MAPAAEAGLWRSAGLLCDDDLWLSCGNSCAATGQLPDAALNPDRFILLIQIAQTLNFLPGACFVFPLGELKRRNVCRGLLLISVKSFDPQEVFVVECACLLQCVIVRSHSWLMKAYLGAFFHADGCGTQIVFLRIHSDTLSPTGACVFNN